MQIWVQRGLPLLVLIASIALRWWDPAFMQDVRYLIFDQYQRISPRTYVPSPVRIVDIDDATLQKYGQWPWPRNQTAQLVQKLTEGGAAAIALDIVFAEPDRTAPVRIGKSWGVPEDDPALANLRARVGDPDDALTKALAAGPTVLGFVMTAEKTEKDPVKKVGFAKQGVDPLTSVIRFPGSTGSLIPFQKAAKGNGSINMVPDRDGMVRRVPLILGVKKTLYPSLAAESLRVALRSPTYLIKSTGAQGASGGWWQTGVGTLTIDQRQNVTAETDETGQMWLHDTGHIKERYIPAWRVLDGEDVQVKGMIVFIGASAPGLNDIRTTPNQPVIAGVEVHAQAVEQIIHKDFLVVSIWSREVEVLAILGLGLVMVILLPLVGPVGCATLGGLVVAMAFTAAWYAYKEFGLLYDPVFPAASAMGTYITGLLLSYQRSDVERKRVRNAFGHYLSPTMVERVAADPSSLKLGGEIRDVTVLFCDVRDFTSIAESMNAEQLTSLLNKFLTPMTEAVLSNDGTIDKYIGDSVMAFWNAPVDDDRHAAHACTAALDMRKRLAALNAELATAEGGLRQYLRIGVGLNTGPCCVGNLGAVQRFNYSAMGDDVNLASRIEGITKVYGLDILISESTRKLAPDFATVEIGDVRVKGKAMAAKIHALIGGPELAANPRYPELASAIGNAAAAIRGADGDEAERWLNIARGLALDPDLEPLFVHMSAVVQSMLRLRTA